MAKIAIDVEQAVAQRERNGTPGSVASRVLGQGPGWSVEDVVCNSGPQDRPFEELHSKVSIAMVVAGTFQYRSGSGRSLMTPGSLLLGNAGQCFECGHEHAAGDRCIAFRFEPDYFAELVRDEVGVRFQRFTIPRLPPMREFSPSFARAIAVVIGRADCDWEEISLGVAATTAQLAKGDWREFVSMMPSSEARITRAIRLIDSAPSEYLTLRTLAREARLSPYHFLRVFESATGLTPHQYIRRARLRHAATRIATEPHRILEIALESGFGDVSNFNRSFRAEFGISPRVYRAQTAS